MFEKLGQRAEQFATRLPRRAFFGKVARAALPLAAALGGVCVLPRDAHAAGLAPLRCCYDDLTFVPVCRIKKGEECPPGTFPGQCPIQGKAPPACY